MTYKLKMVEIYSGKDDRWKGWHNAILDASNSDGGFSLNGPIDPERSKVWVAWQAQIAQLELEHANLTDENTALRTQVLTVEAFEKSALNLGYSLEKVADLSYEDNWLQEAWNIAKGINND